MIQSIQLHSPSLLFQKNLINSLGRLHLESSVPQLPNPRNLMILIRKSYFHLLSPQEGASAWLSVGSSSLSSFFQLHLTSSHFTTPPEDDPSIAPRFLKSTLSSNCHLKCPTHQGDEWQKSPQPQTVVSSPQRMYYHWPHVNS